MYCHIFTYGSLMFPQVWSRVVRGAYRSEPATLAGYARFAVAGRSYPGIAARRDAHVDGVLYFDVTPQDMAVLDAFEGDEYRRERVRVTLGNGAPLDAAVYVYLYPQKLSDSPWSPQRFRIADFLAAYCTPDRRGSPDEPV